MSPRADVDALIALNFGDGESLWNPKCFDKLYTLGEPICAVCTLQKWDGGWILGDVCVSEKRKGYGTRVVDLALSNVKGPIWADANAGSAGIFEKDIRWRKATHLQVPPWEASGVWYVS
jgi:hypothetical protein